MSSSCFPMDAWFESLTHHHLMEDLRERRFLKFRHPERSECGAFAQPKDPAAFTRGFSMAGKAGSPMADSPPAMDWSAALMPRSLALPPGSFDSARLTARGKTYLPLASLRMTDLARIVASLWLAKSQADRLSQRSQLVVRAREARRKLLPFSVARGTRPSRDGVL